MSPAASSQQPPNRLIHETSPYLLQHARNPVDWYPWGDEAFARARELDKPVFLSVGYSACHWCHVMERESFEDDGIAAVMNEHYINIKVDREERPDVDQIYMSAVQLMTHRGGWPMSVFMTPDARPFYGGTYWPPTSRMGMPGFRDILLKLAEYWTLKRDEVLSSADSLVEAISRISRPEFEPAPLNEDTLRAAQRSLISSADRRYGGFGDAPKFPHPMDIRVLLHCWKRFANDDALQVARLTLDRMALGGIYDHLGGGFHRYSTDAHWLVPHFEKMLYDNALLVPAYLEAHQTLNSTAFRRDPQGSAAAAAPPVNYASVARETLDYTLREMTQPDGGFYSTQDADSEGEEGKFFVWTEDQIIDLLGHDDARVFNYCYDVTPRGNWEGHTILNRPKPHAQAASILGLSEDALQEVLDRAKSKLFAAREERVHPGRDDKIIVAWNGLMITAMSLGARVLNAPQYAAAAARAADFILNNLRDDSGRLLHTFKDGRPRINAFLDDYACLIDGLVELYQATFDPRWLASAVELAEQLIDRYADPDHGGFFYTPADHETLIARSKDTQDSATPSGNGMAATALLKLGRLTARTDLEDQGFRTLQSLSGLTTEHPRAAAQALLALDFQIGPAREVVLLEADDHTAADSLLQGLAGRFVPNTLIIRHRAADSPPPVLAPLLTGKSLQAASLTAYVCHQGACGLPVSGPELLESLEPMRRSSPGG